MWKSDRKNCLLAWRLHREISHVDRRLIAWTFCSCWSCTCVFCVQSGSWLSLMFLSMLKLVPFYYKSTHFLNISANRDERPTIKSYSQAVNCMEWDLTQSLNHCLNLKCKFCNRAFFFSFPLSSLALPHFFGIEGMISR